jgi:2-polyprenyl-3-methyl-5-hydroxy-6-metoxy-1,4-benzoquinol methylase
MIGTALKQLGQGISQYLAFQAARIFRGSRIRRPLAQDPLTSTSAAPEIDRTMGKLPPEILPDFQPVRPFDWQILSKKDGHIYTGGPSVGVLELLIREPKFVLDVGCSNGDFAVNVKQRYPQSTIWGIEPNESAARIAATRVNRVLAQTIEEVDWDGEGVQRGKIDTVFLFDVLEHIYNPWRTLLTLRNLVSAEAQIIVSIPNVRNVLLLQDLVSGYWRYRPGGLLDITHIRFFTQKDMLRMFYQTGFRVVKAVSTQCAPSAAIFEKHRNGQFPQTIQLESASITAHSIDDLSSLCAVQHMYCLQPANHDQLSARERELIDAPHPPTMAFALD